VILLVLNRGAAAPRTPRFRVIAGEQDLVGEVVVHPVEVVPAGGDDPLGHVVPSGHGLDADAGDYLQD